MFTSEVFKLIFLLVFYLFQLPGLQWNKYLRVKSDKLRVKSSEVRVK